MKPMSDPPPFQPTRAARILGQVLAEIAQHPGRERFSFDPLLLAELWPEPAGSDGPAPRLAALERELVRVHRGELARLCRAAAALRLRQPGSALDPAEISACLSEELELLGGGGGGAFPDDLLVVLRRCLGADVAHWPSATALAAVSLLLAPHELGRLWLGQALLAAGEADDAARVFAVALARGPSRRGRALLRLGLGLARRRCEREEAEK